MMFDNHDAMMTPRPAIGTAPQPEAAPEPAPSVSPGLRWAVKLSFLDYLSRLPDGRMSVTHGAVHTGGDEVVWQTATSDGTMTAGGDARTFRFGGDLRYAGHGGLLFLRLAEPHVTLRGDAGDLSVLDTFGEVEGGRLRLVTFEVSRRSLETEHEVISADPVRLTEEGAAVFNQVYPVGELFEPFTITWPLKQAGRPAGGDDQ